MNIEKINRWPGSLSASRTRRSEMRAVPSLLWVARRATIIVLLLTSFGASAAENTPDQPFTVEYYYRIQFGHFDEWIALYKKNHWPVMVAEMEDGQVLDIKIDRPRGYRPESYRWDVRVTITFKNVLIPHGLIDRDRESTIARLFPDRDLFEKEEQRRFELLEGLMQVELVSVPTDDW
jgi:hypothetical protein